MAKVRRGALISLGMFMLAGLVFSMAVILFHNTQSAETRFGEMALYDRMYDIDSSLQQGIGRIFSNSGISLSVSGDNVAISETLPGSSSFIQQLGGFIDYSSAAYSSDPKIAFNENVVSLVEESLPVYIMPHNIIIRHLSFPSGNLEIEPSSLNVQNYSILLTSGRTTAGFNDAATTTGSFPLKVSVATASGTSVWLKNVNPSLPNTLSITFDSGLPTENIMTITLTNPARLLISRGSLALSYQVDIGLVHQAGQMAEAMLPSGLYSISFRADRLSREGAVKLA